MRKPFGSAAQRVTPVLDVVNDPTNIYAPNANVSRWEAHVRQALQRYLEQFDGTPESGYVEVFQPSLTRTTPDELYGLIVELNLLLESGFGEPEMTPTLPMPTLRLGARNTRRPEIKRSRATQRERRSHDSAGAFVLQVDGGLRDVVLFLTLHLLAAPGMAGAIRHCQAPAPHNWQERCGKWLVRSMGPGQPRNYCSDRCRVRFAAEKEAKTRKKAK
jgi:hypothetical protein